MISYHLWVVAKLGLPLVDTCAGYKALSSTIPCSVNLQNKYLAFMIGLWELPQTLQDGPQLVINGSITPI